MALIETVGELIQALEELQGEIPPETISAAPIRVATQPGFPLRAVILQVRELDGTIWIATDHTSNNPYAPRDAWADPYEESH
ncbi:MAG: hypothetical protein LC687_00075 [Actinobacteria bacterium]|nr:hypothetical protein [Actinomycetota bacterium]